MDYIKFSNANVDRLTSLVDHKFTSEWVLNFNHIVSIEKVVTNINKKFNNGFIHTAKGSISIYCEETYNKIYDEYIKFLEN